MHQFRSHHFAAFVILVLLGVCSAATAGQVVWNGSSDSNWSTAANWTPGTAPTAGDDVVLTGSGTNPTNQDIVGLNIKSLTFDSSATVAYTISGNAISLIGSGTTLSVDPAAANHTLATDLNFLNTQSWFVGAGRNLTLSGTITQVPAPDVLYYKFDEASGTTAADGSGNGRPGSLVGGATFVAGQVGNGVQLDGASGYVQAPSFQLSGGPVTFAAWVYSSNPFGLWNRVFDFGDGPSSNNLLLAFSGTSGQMTLQNFVGAANQGAITSGAVFPTNTWVHVAVTITPGNAVMYWNGVAQASGNIGTLANTARANQYIGKSNWASDALFNGIIDDFRIYNRVLSATDVGQLFAGNELLSPSVLTKTGTGQLIFAGSASYPARLVINAGTVEGNTASLPASITNSASLVFNQTVDGTYNGNISGTGSVTKNGAAVLSVNGFNTYSGATTINAGTMRVVAAPGLLEGRVNGGFDLTTPNPATSTQLTTRYANIVDSGSAYPNTGGAWADNTTFIYSGSINNPNAFNVTYTFAENFDDSVQLKIDGNTLLFDGSYNNPTLATYTLTPGLHAFELRLGEGGGGVGPSNAPWLNNGIGFGYDPLGQNQQIAANYSIMTDPGDGSLFISSPPNALSTASDFTVNAGGTLDLNNFTATIASLSGSGSVLLGDGSLRTGASNASTTFSGIISGATGTLIKLGTGAFTLSGNNTYAGTTTISAGTLQVGAGGTSGTLGSGNVINNKSLIFNRSDASAYSGSISGPGSVVKNGAGILTLSGVSTFTGGTAINAGTIQLSLSAGAIAGSQLWLDGADATTLFKDGAGTIPVAVNGDTVALWKDKSGNNRDASQPTGAQQPLYNLVSNNGQSAVRFDGADDLLNVDLSFLVGNQYTFFVVEGKRSTQNNNYFLGTGTGATNEGLHVGYRGDTDYTLAQYANDLEYVNGSLQLTSTQVFRTWLNMLDGAGHTIFLNGTPVSSNGNTSPFLTANFGTVGRGFTGGTQYNGDIAEVIFFNSALTPSARQAVETYLFAKWNGILPSGGAVSIAAGATLDLNGVSQTIASLADIGGAAGTVTNNSPVKPAKLTVNSPSGTATFSGVIQDGTSATGFVKAGAFTQILAGANTQTGGTFINAGTLQVGDGGLNGSIAGDIVDNATLLFSYSVPITYAGAVSGTGAVSKIGSGALMLTGSSTYTGATTVTTGILRLSGANGSINGSSSIVINSGTFDIDSSAGTSSRISDTASITFNGGTFSMTAPVATPRVETVGALIFNSGASTISITPDATADAQLISSSFARNGGATFNFVRVTAGPESANLFTGGIPDNTFIGYATVNSASAQYTTANGLVNTVPIFTVAAGDWDLGTNWSGGSAPTVTDDVIVRHAMVLPGNRDVRSLAFDIGSPDISGAFTLNDNSGLITCSGAVAPTISSDLTTAGKWNIIQDSTGTLSISGSMGPNNGVAGAVGQWTFDESSGSNVIDSSGFGNNGTLQNDVTRVAGRIGSGALQFGGVSGYVDIPGFTWPAGGGPVSVSFWNYVALSDVRQSVGFGVGNGSSGRFASHSPWVNNLLFWDFGNIGGTGRVFTSYAGHTDKWTHITLVSGGSPSSSMSIYFDGVPVQTSGGSDAPATAVSDLQIGHTPEDAIGFQHHKGMIDDFRIYNRVLSAAEVGHLFADDSVALTKSGTGTLALSGANTYDGVTTVSAGIVNISNSSALGTTVGGTVVANGAALEVSGNISLGAEALTLGGTGIANGGALRNVSGTNSIAGSMYLASDTLITVVGAAESLTINGGVAGTGALTKNGPGTLILGGPSTNTATVTISAGTLQGTTDSLKGNIVNNGALIFDQTTNGGYAGDISGSGTFTKSGIGSVTISGNNTYAGTTSVLAGTLKTVPAAPAPGSAIWLDSGALSTLTKDGSNRISEWRDRAGGTDKVVQANAGQQPTYVASAINGLPTVRVNSANGQTMTTLTNFAAPSTVLYVARQLGGTNRRVLSGINNNWLLGFFNGGRSYAYFNGWVDQAGVASNTNPYLYSATIPGPGNNSSFYENGVLLASNQGGVEGPNGLTLNGQFGEYSDADIAEVVVYKSALSDSARQISEAYLAGKWMSFGSEIVGNSLPDGTAVTVSPGATLDVSGVNETIGSLAGDGFVLLGAGTLTTGGTNASTTYAGVISGSLGNLTKVGTGTFILSGANSYGGTTTVSAGVLRALTNTALGSAAGGTTVASGAALEIDGGLTMGAEALTLAGTGIANGGALRSISGDNVIGFGAITLSADAMINVVANSLTLNGAISGAFGIEKSGGGLLSLGGFSKYTGATTISQGTVQLQSTTPPAGYAAYYSFDSVTATSVLNEGSALNKNGTLTGATSIVSGGILGNALSVQAAGNNFMAINLTNIAGQNKGIDLSGGNWTASAWFNGLYPASNWRTLYRGATNDHPVIIENGSTRLGMYDTATGGQFRPSGYDVATGGVQTGWHQLVAVGSGTTTAMYIDGVLVGTSDRNSAADIYAVGNIQGGSQPFAQLLDEVRIYQRALTLAEIQQLNRIYILPVTTQVRIAAGATLDVNGIKQTVGSIADIPGPGVRNILLGAGTLTTGNDNSDTVYSGTISGGGALTKIGTGAFEVSGISTYGGATTINGGILRASSTTAVPSASPVVFANVVGAKLDVNIGVLTLTVGSLAGGGPLGGNITLGNSTLDIGGNNSSTGYSGAISGTGGIIKNGTGTQSLGGSNVYSGTTLVNAGTLKAGLPPPGSVLWLDGTDASTMTLNGLNQLSEWRDKTGLAEKLVQGNASQQPTFTPNGINGLPVVRLVAANTQTMSTTTNFTAPSTVLYVARHTGGSNLRLLCGINNNWLLGFWGNQRHVAYFEGWVNQAGSAPDTLPYLYSATIPGPGQNTSFYENGLLVASNQGGIQGPNGLSLSGEFNEYSNGDIAEILVYNSALNNTARQQAEAYLNAKWFGISMPINAIPDNSDVTVAPGATLDVSGALETIGSLAGNGSVLVKDGTLTTGGTNASTTYAGVISGTAGSLVKQGAGTMTLSGVNTYTGATTVAAGVLAANNDASLGTAAGGTTVQVGAELDVSNNISLTDVLTLGGNGVGGAGALRSLSGVNSFGNTAITLTADTTIGVDAGSLTLNGGMTGAFSITKVGAGDLILGASNNYTGSTTISAGTVRLNAPILIPEAYYSFDNVVGTTVINGGSLPNKNADMIGAVSIVPGGVQGNALSVSQFGTNFLGVNLTNIGGQNKGIDLSGGNWTTSVWFNGLYPNSQWRTLYRGNVNDHQVIIENGSNRLGIYDNASNGQFRPSGYDVNVGGVQTGWHRLVAVGSGTTTSMYIDDVFVGASDMKSVADIYAIGNIQFGGQSFAQLIDEVSIYQKALTIDELNGQVLPSGTQVLIANGATLDVNGVKQTVGSVADIGGAGSILLGAGSLTTGKDNQTTSYSGTIAGGGSLTKIGSGAFTLSGTSTYGGTTTINGGILRASSTTALPSTTAVTIANVAGAGLDLNAVSLTIGSLSGGGPSGGNVTLGGILTSGGNNLSTSFGGVLSGAGGIVKTGGGTLTLSGANTYGGVTDVSAGVLKITGLPLAGMGVWLDAADAASLTVDGTNHISQWNDKSSNARHFSQGSGTSQPIYTAGALNGLAVVRLDGIDDRLTLNSATNPRTVFFVNVPAPFTYQVGTSWLNGIYGNSNPGDKGIRMDSATNWANPGDGNDYGNGGGAYFVNGVATGTFTSGAPQVLTAQRGGAFSGTYNNTHLGWYYDTSRAYKGDLAEVLIYESVLNTAQQQAVEGYLMSKWGMGVGTFNVLPDGSAVSVALGATLDVSNINETIGSLAGAGSVLLGGATLTAGGDNSTTSFSGVLSGTGGGLAKQGIGALTLTGTNSYTGATSLNGGTLLVDGSIGAGAVTTLAGTTLGGIGTINGSVTASGDVSPGNGGIGTLSVGGAMDFAAGSSFTVQLDGTLPSSDQLNVTGSVTIGANVALNASLGTPTVHLNTLTIINNLSAGAVTGTFNGLPNRSTLVVAPRNFAVRYDLGSGNDVVLIDEDPPTAIPQTVTPLEDVLYTITLSGSDPNADPLTFAIVSGPANGTLGMVTQLTPTTASVTYTGNLNFNGADSFTFTVDDGTVTSTPGTVTVNVTAVNDVPSFTKGADPTVLEDAAPVTITGWATAISAGPPDEIGQSLTFIVTGNSNAGLFAAGPAIASNGDLSFTPALNANGSATITIKLQDGGGILNGGVDTSGPQTFTIFVTAVNDVPSFTVGIDQTVLEDSGAQTVANWITVMSPGPPDEAGQNLTFNVTANSNASLFSVQPSVSSAGTLTYTPAANANGSATITLNVQDTGGILNGGVDTSATQTFIINVTAVNDPPVATAQTVTPLEDVGLLISLAGADSDPEVVQTLTFTLVTPPTFGTLTGFNAATGQVTYTGFADYNGPDSFTFTVTDDNTAGAPFNLTSAPATVTVNVTAVNDAPSFTAGPNQLVLEDAGPQSVAGWATGRSTGPADESTQVLSFVITANTNPAMFSAGPAVASDGTLTYTTAPNANGSATITLLIMDDGGVANGGVNVSATQTFIIDVTPVNDQPVALAQSVQTGEDTAILISLTGDDADPEVAQTLTFAIVTPPTKGTLSGFNPATGQVTYTPNLKYNGSDSFTFTVTDDGLAGATANLTSAPGTVSLTVSNTNNAPTTTDQALSTGFQVPLAIALGADDGDPDVVQVLTFKIVTPPANGLLSNFNAATGTVTYTPSNGFTGVDSFAYTVTDDAAAGPIINLTSTPGTITITVTPAPSFGSTPTVSPDTAVVGQLLVFTAGTVGTSTIVWDFGDGVTANGGSATHTYTVPGIYTASVTATSPQGVKTTFIVSIFVGLDTTTGSSAGATIPGVTGILVGGVGQQKAQGGTGKMVCNFSKRDRTWVSGSVGQIAFPSGVTLSTLNGANSMLTLGKGSLAQTFYFTVDKRGRGKATSLPKFQIDLKKKRILFKVNNREELTDLAESLGANFVRGTKKGPPVIVLLPATIQIGTQIYLAITFQLEYRQTGTTGKAGLKP